MAVSPARAAAFEILLRVGRESAYASELLHSERCSELSLKDRGLATELVMGVLRWRSLLDRRLAHLSSHPLQRLDPEVLTALRLGIYQLQFLSKIPARAAIFESVELVKQARKRSAAPFLNAVLRKAGAQKPDPLGELLQAQDTAALAASSAHPEWLVMRWIERFGLDVTRQICLHNQRIPEAAIHVPDPEVACELERAGLPLAPGKLLSNARRVRAADVIHTEAYCEGRIWIQDEASQLVALLLGRGKSILDCCAAPGGKTAVLARRNPSARVIAADLHPHRARVLRKLAARPNICVIAADARQLPFTTTFDRILADVPCSGTGTLAHNPEIKWRLAPSDLLDLQSRQTAILQSALAHLAPGGRLVYSTCSLEKEENDDVVQSVLATQRDFKIVDCRSELEKLQESGELLWRDIDSLCEENSLRTLPGTHPADGFFAAIIERSL